jgi:hypothetical protein
MPPKVFKNRIKASFSWISSIALKPRSSSRESGSSAINRSMSFNDSSALRRFPSSHSMYPQHQQKTSSIQRLIQTFEDQNRQNFEEFQRINSEMRRKLENSVHQEETLRDLLRLRQERIRQQDASLKHQADLEKRLENANRKMQNMLKDLQFRETDINRQQAEYDSLERRHEAECRKAEEVR